MHSCRDEYDRFIVPELDDFLIAERRSFRNLKPFFSFMRRNHNKIDDSSFIALIEKILPKKYFFIVMILLIECQNVRPALLVTIGVGKGKLNAGNKFIKQEIEPQHELIFAVQGEGIDGVGQSFPSAGLTVFVADAVHWSVHMVSFGLNGYWFTIANRKCTLWTEKVTFLLENPPASK